MGLPVEMFYETEAILGVKCTLCLNVYDFNGEYSGQIFLFMPQPPKSQILIFALFLAAFFVAPWGRPQKFSQKVTKMARSAKF